MLVVLDTSVLVAGLRSRNGGSNAVLEAVARGKVTMLASPPLFLEYEEVLLRQEHREVCGLSQEGVGEFLSELAAVVRPVQVHFRWRPQLVDPADEIVLEAAINGQADVIVTHNTRHFARAKEQFGILIWQPVDLLKRLKR